MIYCFCLLGIVSVFGGVSGVPTNYKTKKFSNYKNVTNKIHNVL